MAYGINFVDPPIETSRSVEIDRGFLAEIARGLLKDKGFIGFLLKQCGDTGTSDEAEWMGSFGIIKGKMYQVGLDIGKALNGKVALYDVYRIAGAFHEEVLTAILPLSILAGKNTQVLEAVIRQGAFCEGFRKGAVTKDEKKRSFEQETGGWFRIEVPKPDTE